MRYRPERTMRAQTTHRPQVAALALGVFACGDNLVREEPLEPTSGSQLKLVGYLFDDGTRHWGADELYDAALHTRCTRQRWIDGIDRCVPVAAEAVYTDPGCTTVVGRGVELELVPPKYFIGHDRIDSELVPARFYRAGAATEPVLEVYELRDGACEGPVFESPGSTYYAIIEEIPGTILVPVRIETVGTGRVGLRALVADDGLFAPVAFEDRDLAVDCRPSRGADGSSACVPVEPTAAGVFADPACTEPAVADADPAPRIVRVDDASGCPRYHGVGAPITPPVYRSDGRFCTVVRVIPGEGWRALGERLELAPIERELEPGTRRLGHGVVRTDGLHAVDGELYDGATRTACEPLEIQGVVRCIPTPIAPAAVRYVEGCGLEVRIAEVPAQPCEPVAFALATSALGNELHAIGEPIVDPVYEWVGSCLPYVPPPGIVVHALGPALPPDVFAGALSAEDR